MLLVCLSACEKEEILYPEVDRIIKISDNIVIDNGVKLRHPIFNYNTYDAFLNYLSTSDRFLIVQQKDFLHTTSTDKVIISLRYDIDDNINAAIKFAYRENKYGIKSTYFVLHTVGYYGTTTRQHFQRNDNLIYYLKYLQDVYGHEIGFHNDLLTLQIVYEINPKVFLRNELNWLRENGIDIRGTTYHGSSFTNLYPYNNSYFWFDYPDSDISHQFVTKGYTTYTIERDSLANYNFEYEGGKLHEDYFFSDSYSRNGQRWDMSQVNLDTIKLGKKVIIMLHPQHWD